MTDIGNAYLQAKTNEKLYVIAGPEFGEREGHILIVYKSLYGLKTSGVRWHERLSDVLLEMGFMPTKTNDDIWMRDMGDHYEYIARYVDDFVIVSTHPEAIAGILQNKYGFKLKGTGPIEYHLGLDYFRDSDGTLCASPTKYLTRVTDTYMRLIGTKPKQTYTSPLAAGDHPELDTSPELDLHGIDREVDRAVSAHQDHRRGASACFELGAELEAGHAVHPNVREHEVGVERLELAKRFLRALGSFDPVALLLEKRAKHQPDVFLIVDDQNAAHTQTLYFLHSRRGHHEKVS